MDANKKKIIDRIMKNENEHLIFGYVHQIEQNYKNMNIPIDIINLVAYFYLLYDEWDVNEKSECIQLSNNNTCIQNIDTTKGYYTMSSIFGTTICKRDNGKYEWKLQVTNTNTNHQFEDMNGSNVIGIIKIGRYRDKSKNIDLDDDFLRSFYGYGVCHGKAKATCNVPVAVFFDSLQDSKYGELFANINDTMTVCLDMDNYTLSYNINGTDYGKAFDVDKDSDYKFAVSIRTDITLQMCFD